MPVAASSELATAPADGGVTVGGVFFLTLIMAAMSGLGALPFLFVGRLSPRVAALANALACGVMLAASFDLVHEGEPDGPGLVVLGTCAGAIFIALLQRALHGQEDVKFAALRGADARKTLLMVSIMAAHSLGEGSGVGVSFSGRRGWAQGQLVTLAIGVHNIPEGMAVATVLASRGVPAWKCAAWAVVTSLPQPLLAVPAFLFVETFAGLLPFAMGFAAGCMVWITVAELLPDALEGADASTVATAATLSAAALEAFRMWMAALENPDGSFRSPFRIDRETADAAADVAASTLAKTVPITVPDASTAPIDIDIDPVLVPVAPVDPVPVPGDVVGGGGDISAGAMFFASLATMAPALVALVVVWRVLSRRRAFPDGVPNVNVNVNADDRRRGLAGTFLVPAEALGGAAGVATVAAAARLADAIRRRRFGAAPLAPTTLGVAVGLVAHVLSVEYHEGRGKTTARGFEHARERRERRRREAANGWGEDPESAAGSRYAASDDAFDEGTIGTLADANGARDVNGARDGARDGTRDGARDGTLVSALDPARGVSFPAGRVTLWAMTAFAAAEGAGLAAATAAAGDAGLIFLPATIRAAPRALAALAVALASGRDAFDAAKDAARVAAAAPLGLVLTASVGGMGPAASVGCDAAAAAALLSAATRAAAPAATKWDPERARGGFAVGVGLEMVVLVVGGALCWMTPYCDRTW